MKETSYSGAWPAEKLIHLKYFYPRNGITTLSTGYHKFVPPLTEENERR
jgi:hypothetical protein